ncbi:MAG: DNA gyrase inhibitor YacG [Planctomycetota bacterium]
MPSDAAEPPPCPICKGTVEPDATTSPFCSKRCRLVDLNRWLDGKYQVPAVEGDGDEVEGVVDSPDDKSP